MRNIKIVLSICVMLMFASIGYVAYGASRQINITADADSFIAITCVNSVAQIMGKSDNKVDVECVAILPTATFTSIPTSTPMPLPTATETPSPTNTIVIIPPTDIPGNTPTLQPTIALKDYPLCASHDITMWHSTIDTINQCHYDHSHGDNPSLADDVFGAWTFTQTVSYPHASSPAENMYEQYLGGNIDHMKKHAGYFFIVRKNLPDSPVAVPNWNVPPASYVRDIRAQIHFWGAGDTTKRFHSFFYEIRVQSKITGQYGIIKTGGLMDTGILQLYKKQWIPLLGEDPSMNELRNQWLPAYDANIKGSIDPYRGYKQTCEQIQSRFNTQEFWSPTFNMTIDNTGLSSDVLWSLAPNVHGYNRIAGVSIEKYDNSDCITAGAINLSNPYSATYQINDICTLGGRPNCRLNGTEVGMFMTFVVVPPEWDGVLGDMNPSVGLVSMHKWTNNKQEIVDSCNSTSYNCIPLILENMPVQNSFFQWNGNGKQMVSEFDLTPPDHIINGRWESWHRQ